MYTLKYSDILKAFFTIHHVGHCCTNVIWGHCCTLGDSFTNLIRGHCYATVFQQCPVYPLLRKDVFPTMEHSIQLLSDNDPRSCRLLTPVGKTRQANMDGHIRCPSLTLEREEHLKIWKLVHAKGILTHDSRCILSKSPTLDMSSEFRHNRSP
jgi:hypothetical protein